MRRCRGLVRGAAVVAALCLVGCDVGGDDSATPPDVATTDVAATATSEPASETTAPPTTAGGSTVPENPGVRAVLDEVLGWMADPATIDPARLAPAFLAEVSAEEMGASFESIGVGRWEARDVRGVGAAGLTATLSGPGPTLTVELAVDDRGRINGLLFQPVELVDPPRTLTELTERLAAVAPTVGLLVADVSPDGSCQPLAALDADRPLPLGSTFKLYVLGAVTSAIERGAISWEQPVTIGDELDSLPSGITQDEPPGSALPVRELARRMIELSDNTATDYLIDLVGRPAAEAQLAILGHHDPAITLPFHTTRELFVVKADPDLLARYELADEAGRRALLDGEVAAAALPGVDDLWVEPRAVETVEWFGSPADICRALVSLSDRAARPGMAPIGEILAGNPGVPVDPAQFTTVLFKGGSEPGVIFTAWLGVRPDGTRRVVAGGAVDPAAPIDPTAAQLLALGLTLP